MDCKMDVIGCFPGRFSIQDLCRIVGCVPRTNSIIFRNKRIVL